MYFYLSSCFEFSSPKAGISVGLPPLREQHTDNRGNTVCYSLGIYLLNLFLAFLTPKFDPSLEQELADQESEEGTSGTLPTNQDDEFRPFIRRYFDLRIIFSPLITRLPEFKFWHSATRATAIAFVCTWFSFFDVPYTPSLPIVDILESTILSLCYTFVFSSSSP